jgi:cbb3-type cytochrome oxidase maturation protein
MEVLILLVLVSLLLAGAFLVVFVWASRTGQFDDTTTPALRMLVDDPRATRREPPPSPRNETP